MYHNHTFPRNTEISPLEWLDGCHHFGSRYKNELIKKVVILSLAWYRSCYRLAIYTSIDPDILSKCIIWIKKTNYNNVRCIVHPLRIRYGFLFWVYTHVKSLPRLPRKLQRAFPVVFLHGLIVWCKLLHSAIHFRSLNSKVYHKELKAFETKYFYFRSWIWV